MSLSLLQGYSSAEEEDELEPANDETHLGSSSEDDARPSDVATRYDSSVFQFPNSSHNSALPSAFDAFSQISGPPEFLNSCVEEQALPRDADRRHGGRRNRKNKKDLPAASVVEAKAQLVGIHERVRSDMEGGKPPTSSVSITTENGAKRVASATNPNAEDAAELFRMCVQCGIPKTYSSARGIVCPVCGDRPPKDANSESKKKGSTVKDKEKAKRMKGQSSHASWKSETEMQLRQQFD